MGRNRSDHLNLPRGMRARVRPSATYYYYDAGDKEGLNIFPRAAE